MDDAVPHRTLYREVAARLAEVVTTAGSDLGVPVRACPVWSASDMLGHLVGVAQDWVSGRLDHYGSPDWTSHQVRRHSGDDQAELFEAWSTALDQLDNAAPHPVMGFAWRWLFGDALAHEADLYETLDPQRRPPPAAVAAGLAGSIGRWRDHLSEAAAPPLEIVVHGVRSWWVGRPADDHVTLWADAYDVWRFLCGRTSRERVEELAWSHDPGCYLDLGLAFPFQFPVGTSSLSRATEWRNS